MKIQIKQHINRFTFYIFLTATFWITGCSAPRPTPDPLAGWKIDFNHQPGQAIVKDCQDFMQTLPPEEKKFASWGHYYENEDGQHAVVIEIALNGRWWNYVLIYSKDDKRIRTIRYSPGRYRS